MASNKTTTKAAPKTKKTALKKKAAKKSAPKKVAKKSAPKNKAAKKSAPTKALARKPIARSRPAAVPRPKGEPARADPAAIAERLAIAIQKPECELAFNTPFELVTATILAAQSTDKTVNQVMPTLLARFPDAAALAQSSQEEVEVLVKRTGFFRNKAKAIRGMAQHLVAEHGGEVPRTIEQMIELPGVARKTANVVLGTAYGISSGFVVDTHVTRVAQRLALSANTDPVSIEQDLCRLFAQSEWVSMGHRLVLHGRYTCLAKQPLCEDCALNELCPSRQAGVVDPWQARAERQNLRTNTGLLASRGR